MPPSFSFFPLSLLFLFFSLFRVLELAHRHQRKLAEVVS